MLRSLYQFSVHIPIITALARPISAGTRAGEGDFQGVEAHWPLASVKKDANDE